MIKFKKDITLNVITGFDEATDNITDEELIIFKAGMYANADIYNEVGDYADIKFVDGSIAQCVLRSCFEIVK